MKKFICSVCGYIYDEAAGIPDRGIEPGTKWEELPPDWVCPLCGAPKSAFREKKEEGAKAVSQEPAGKSGEGGGEELRELSFGEMSAVCSNLAKGCEKQYLAEEMELFLQLAGYFKAKAAPADRENTGELLAMVSKDLETEYPQAEAAAEESGDRGARRALVWSGKVTRMLEALLERYENEQGAFLEHTKVFVCDICGFIYIGDEAPAICPVCKVPSLKIMEVQRR